MTMKEYELKYGCNPNQKPSAIRMKNGAGLPLEVVNGRPGYINFLDALNSWQLVKEIREALGTCAAASFKHVSPTSAAIGLPLPEGLKKACRVEDIEGLDDSPLASAYARARGTDRMSSFGDWIALSDPCDEVTARLIKREVSDGVIAPGYSPEALAVLKEKKKGGYNVIQIDPAYEPEPVEEKDVFGITFSQRRNDVKIDASLFGNIVTANKDLPEEAVRDLIIAMLTLKYTQSNSVCFAADGQAIGVGAGQQSRIHCTRLAGDKADNWHLRQYEKVLDLPFIDGLGRPEKDNAVDQYLLPASEAGYLPGSILADGVWQQYFTVCPEPLTRAEKQAYLSEISGVSLASDAFFPFGDNIDRAAQSGVKYVAQPGGSVRDDHVIGTCDRYGMVMSFTGVRLFHH